LNHTFGKKRDERNEGKESKPFRRLRGKFVRRVHIIVFAAFLAAGLVSQAQSQDKRDSEGPKLIWTIDELPSTSLASAAVGDITADEKPEIVFGTY